MHKLKNKIVLAIAAVLLAAAYLGAVPCSAAVAEVYVGGMPAGFTLGMDGAQVVGICEVLTESGASCPAREAGLEVGDVIVAFNGIKITSAEDIGSALACCNGRRSQVTLRSDEGDEKVEISPVKDLASGKYKIGVLIRDSVSGIGTVTYIEKNSLRFGSLGHPVSDESGKLMPLGAGNIYRCTIVSVVKGERGRAGELKGLFMGEGEIASADKNCETGIYGNFAPSEEISSLRTVQVGADARPGKACVISTVDGIEPKEYEVSIVKVDAENRQNKNFVLKVTDARLLAATGGIVQGMSGSPILQDGKLIGAVTHVFLNDPTRGYGIAIQKMIGN